jgi:hypothetical protein
METSREHTKHWDRERRAKTSARQEAERLFRGRGPQRAVPDADIAPRDTRIRKPRILPALTPQEWRERRARISEEPSRAPAVEKQTPNQEKISGKQFAQIVSLLKAGLSAAHVARMYSLNKTDIYQEIYERGLRIRHLQGR